MSESCATTPIQGSGTIDYLGASVHKARTGSVRPIRATILPASASKTPRQSHNVFALPTVRTTRINEQRPRHFQHHTKVTHDRKEKQNTQKHIHGKIVEGQGTLKSLHIPNRTTAEPIKTSASSTTLALPCIVKFIPLFGARLLQLLSIEIFSFDHI